MLTPTEKALKSGHEQLLACPVEFMHVTLTYDGPLHAASNKDPRTEEKNAIRRKFHAQLADMWLTHPALDGWLYHWEMLDQEQRYRDLPNNALLAHRCGAYTFIPLVTPKHHMICDLDVLFLRRAAPGELIHGGDLDNRLKTLFDALSMPAHENQLQGLRTPDEEPTPFFTLLEDDRLITGISVRTAQLHAPTQEGESPSNVRLVIDVTTRITRVTFGNIGLG